MILTDSMKRQVKKMGKYSGIEGDYYYGKKKDATSAASAARKHGCRARVIRETDGRPAFRVKVTKCPKGR